MWHTATFIAICLAIIFGLFAWVVPASLNSDLKYSGELVFETEKDYSNFKREIIASKASWNTMQVLSSEPPILVHFLIYVDRNYDFPYGEKSDFKYGYLFFAFFVTCVLVVLTYTIFV